MANWSDSHFSILNLDSPTVLIKFIYLFSGKFHWQDKFLISLGSCQSFVQYNVECNKMNLLMYFFSIASLIHSCSGIIYQIPLNERIIIVFNFIYVSKVRFLWYVFAARLVLTIDDNNGIIQLQMFIYKRSHSLLAVYSIREIRCSAVLCHIEEIFQKKALS